MKDYKIIEMNYKNKINNDPKEYTPYLSTQR